jgi:23S rRNA pseudouridine2605 synthase
MERLQKILAQAGVASRRAAEQLILDGRVSVNGEVASELGTKADARKDEIRVDGKRLPPPAEKVYLLLNKPRGIIATRSDPERRPTVMDLAPKVPGLFPVGRLDVMTEGLLLLTTDGDFAERVSHPRYEVPRVYRAKVRGVPDEATLERLRRGVYYDGVRLAADRVRVVSADNNAWLEIVLHEGKHHEVRHLLLAAGHPVSKLRRVAIGPLTDRGLAPGAWRTLTDVERRALLGEIEWRGPRIVERKRPPRRRPPTRGTRAVQTRGEDERGKARGAAPRGATRHEAPARRGRTSAARVPGRASGRSAERRRPRR